MTQRAFPVMSLFQPEIADDTIIVTHKRTNAKVSFGLSRESRGSRLRASVWNDEVEVFEVDPITSAWFSSQLRMECRLVGFPEDRTRPVSPTYSINNDQVSLADAFPFLLIGQGSLDELNKRLSSPVPMNRFRPNFVITGGAPFEEDNWKSLSVGGSRFAVVKPCDRCSMPTIDQRTGQKGTEPLTTLATFRKFDNKILFGQNLIALDVGGTVSEGDLIDPQ